MRKRQTKSRAYRATPPQQAHGLQQAERWLREGLNAAGIEAQDLAMLKGSDARKLALAQLLWQRTTASQEWIAEKLQMRSAANVSQQLRRLDRQKLRHKIPAPLLRYVEGCLAENDE